VIDISLLLNFNMIIVNNVGPLVERISKMGFQHYFTDLGLLTMLVVLMLS